MRKEVEDTVILVLVLAICLLSVVCVLQYLHLGTRGLVQDLEVEAGMDPRSPVDAVYIPESELETLQEAYTPEKEKQWIANINGSGVLMDLTLIGLGNRTHVTGEYDSDRDPDVLIHSHPSNSTPLLSRLDKRTLLNGSHQGLLKGESLGQQYRMSCILHQNWRILEPQLYCYANPFSYMDEDDPRLVDRDRRHQYVNRSLAEDVRLNRVSVVALD